MFSILKNKKKILIGSLFVILTCFFLYIIKDNLITLDNLIVDGERFKKYLQSFGYLSWVVFFVFQIIQVVIFFIPGEVIQAAGGYLFGTFWGTVLSLLGIGVGSAILFSISHKYGRKFVQRFVSKELHEKIDNILSTERENVIIFLLYLIPGFPKDSLIMICGLTNMNTKDFIIYSMLGRIPALAVSSYFGANMSSEHHLKAIVIAIVATIVTLVAILFKEKLLKKLNKI
jgi:uncharacterized membrane protein YdjX (TVP38/TMEM64 family)